MKRPVYDLFALPRSCHRYHLTGLDCHLLKTDCFPDLSEDAIVSLLEHDPGRVLTKLRKAKAAHQGKQAAKRQGKRYEKRKKEGTELCWCGQPAVPGPDTPRCLQHATGFGEDVVAVYHDELDSPWLRRENGSRPIRTLKKIRAKHT